MAESEENRPEFYDESFVFDEVEFQEAVRLFKEATTAYANEISRKMEFWGPAFAQILEKVQESAKEEAANARLDEINGYIKVKRGD